MSEPQRNVSPYEGEKLSTCEDCGRKKTVTMEIEVTPGKPPVRLCVDDYLTAQKHRVKNAPAATGDVGNPAPVDGSGSGLFQVASFVSEPAPVAATVPSKTSRPRRKKPAV